MGDWIKIGTEANKKVIGFGSVIIDTPLSLNHTAGTAVIVYSSVPLSAISTTTTTTNTTTEGVPDSGQDDDIDTLAAGTSMFFINGGIITALMAACGIYVCRKPQQFKDMWNGAKNTIMPADDDEIKKNKKCKLDEVDSPKSSSSKAHMDDFIKVLSSPKKSREALAVLRDGVGGVWNSDSPTARDLARMEEASEASPLPPEPEIKVVDISGDSQPQLPNAVPTTPPSNLPGPSPMSPLRRALRAFGVAPSSVDGQDGNFPPDLVGKDDRAFPADADSPGVSPKIYPTQGEHKMDQEDWPGYTIGYDIRSSTMSTISQGWQPESEPTADLDLSLWRPLDAARQTPLPLDFSITETLHLGDDDSPNSQTSEGRSQRTLVDAWSERGSVRSAGRRPRGMTQDELDELTGGDTAASFLRNARARHSAPLPSTHSIASMAHMPEPYWDDSSPATRQKYMRRGTALDIDIPSDEDGAHQGLSSPPHNVAWDSDSNKDFASRPQSSVVTPSRAKLKKRLTLDLPDQALVGGRNLPPTPTDKVLMSINSRASWSDQREKYWVDDVESPVRRGVSAPFLSGPGTPARVAESSFSEAQSVNVPIGLKKGESRTPSSWGSEDDKSPLVKYGKGDRKSRRQKPNARSWSVVRHKFWGMDPNSPQMSANTTMSSRSTSPSQASGAPESAKRSKSDARKKSESAEGGFKRRNTRKLPSLGIDWNTGMSPKNMREFSLFGRSEPSIVDLTLDGETIPFTAANADEATRLVSVPDLSVRDSGEEIAENFEDNIDFWMHCKNTGV